MPRSRARAKRKSQLTTFLAISFIFGLILGSVLASIWLGELPALQLEEGEVYKRSTVIVGVEKGTGQGILAALTVEIRTGQGRLLINVPPWENEDTQIAAQNARDAAGAYIESEMGFSLSQVDVIISIENITSDMTIAGPSASAAMAVAIVAAALAKENVAANEIRQDVVVSASIDALGALKPVGEIEEKYETVREAGSFSLFIVEDGQPGNLPNYPGIQVERVNNLDELVDLMLV